MSGRDEAEAGRIWSGRVARGGLVAVQALVSAGRPSRGRRDIGRLGAESAGVFDRGPIRQARGRTSASLRCARDDDGGGQDVEVEVVPTEKGLLIRKRAAAEHPVERVAGILGGQGMDVDAHIEEIRGR